MEPELYGEIFEPLRDSALFRQLYLTSRTIEWPNGADFAPEYLLTLLAAQPAQLASTAERVYPHEERGWRCKAHKETHRMSLCEQIQRTLAASGRVRLPQPEPMTEPYVYHTPVPITGQPVSEIVIEQRGEQ